MTVRLRPRRPRMHATMRGALALVVFSAAVAGASAQDKTKDVEGVEVLERMQAAFRTIAHEVLPCVVEVNASTVVDERTSSSLWLRLPEELRDRMRVLDPESSDAGDAVSRTPSAQFRQEISASGLIVRRQGRKAYVLTNAHVVAPGASVSITRFHLGHEGYGAGVVGVHEAKIVGRDEGRDLALLVFETRDDIPVARLGDSDTVHVGDLAVAIGSPVGVAPSVTTGIVSAVGRRTATGSGVAEFTDYIQTDAAINRWNSGGALVNIRGEVIGINSWIASPLGGSWGVGFAIPINNAKAAVDDLITKGRVEYGWIGVSMGTPSDQLRSAMAIDRAYGAFVFNVFRNSPSHRAGVLPGDFVVRVGDENVRDPNHLLYMVANLTPGTATRLDLLRYGNRRSVMVRIAARDEEMEIADRTERIWPGLAVSPVSDVLRNQLRLGRNAGDVMVGAVVPGSPADAAGFRPGDIVQKINDEDVRSVMDFYRMLNASRGTREIVVYREGTKISVDLAE